MLSVKIFKQLAGEQGARRQFAGVARAYSTGFTLDVEFEAAAGVTILFGASGAGKSATLKAIAGLVRPDSGSIRIGERVLFDSAARISLPIRERRVGYVFQHLALFPHLSALGNVEFALSRLGRHERRRRAFEMLEQFHIAHTAARRPREISGGEAQRVALARALAGDPRLLLLDEPLSALDEATKVSIISDLKQINRKLGLPILYVTHSREEAIALGERALIYEAGRIIAAGEPARLFASPATASVARLTGVENIFAARVVARHEEGGTLTLEVRDADEGVCRIEAPLGHYAEGETVTLAVRAGDILLATVEPRQTSARNILRGRISSLEETARGVRVRARSGVDWQISVTRQAAAELGLRAGREVWLAFKTHSCLLLDREQG